AQRAILDRVEALPAETVPLAEAGGRVLAEDARARVDLPPFDSSAMDGFALRSGETPGSLPVVARVAAGRPAPRELRAGEAMAIATGGVVPGGADAVVPIEYVVQRDNKVEVGGPVGAAAGGRRRRGGASGRSGARARCRRARLVRWRLGRRARPRPAGPRGAPRRRGLLGSLGEAGEARVVRHSRRHARLRAARQ